MKKLIVVAASLAMASAVFAAQAERQRGSVDRDVVASEEVAGATRPDYTTEAGIRALAAQSPDRVVKSSDGYRIYPDGNSAADARTRTIEPMEQGFGTGFGNLKFGSKEFYCQDGNLSLFNNGFSTLIGGSNILCVTYAHIPHGAKIYGISVSALDNDAGINASVTLKSLDSGTDVSTDLVTYTTAGASATPVRRIFTGLSSTVRADSRDKMYPVWLTLANGNANLQIREVTVWYLREVMSATSTGFVDVGSDPTLIRSAEAMKQSGVSVGCTDSSHFCPNDFVTRGQMAIFFGRALGLNVPDNVTPAP